MYKIVKKAEATIRKVAKNKTAFNLITKEVTKEVSLAVIEVINYNEMITAEYNWIYYVLEGVMTLKFANQECQLHIGDSCYVSKGENYKMIGTFKSIVISQPAFGT